MPVSEAIAYRPPTRVIEVTSLVYQALIAAPPKSVEKPELVVPLNRFQKVPPVSALASIVRLSVPVPPSMLSTSVPEDLMEMTSLPAPVAMESPTPAKVLVMTSLPLPVRTTICSMLRMVEPSMVVAAPVLFQVMAAVEALQSV